MEDSADNVINLDREIQKPHALPVRMLNNYSFICLNHTGVNTPLILVTRLLAGLLVPSHFCLLKPKILAVKTILFLLACLKIKLRQVRLDG